MEALTVILLVVLAFLGGALTHKNCPFAQSLIGCCECRRHSHCCCGCPDCCCNCCHGGHCDHDHR